jgi:hypothetical protein
MHPCKVCGAPSQRAVCSTCNPNRSTTEHTDKYASLKEESIEQALPQGGGFDWPHLPEGF